MNGTSMKNINIEGKKKVKKKKKKSNKLLNRHHILPTTNKLFILKVTADQFKETTSLSTHLTSIHPASSRTFNSPFILKGKARSIYDQDSSVFSDYLRERKAGDPSIPSLLKHKLDQVRKNGVVVGGGGGRKKTLEKILYSNNGSLAIPIRRILYTQFLYVIFLDFC